MDLLYSSTAASSSPFICFRYASSKNRDASSLRTFSSIEENFSDTPAIKYRAQICGSPLLVRRGGRDIKKISRSFLEWSGRVVVLARTILPVESEPPPR